MGGRTPLEPLVSQRLNEQQSDGATYLRHALALNPLSGGRRNALRAVRLLEQASELEPDDPIYPYWCGVIYRTFSLWDKAAEYFQRALERDPDHATSRLELAWVYMQMRDFAQARAVLAELAPGAAAGPGVVGVGNGSAAFGTLGSGEQWRLQRLQAILLLEEGHALEAFDTYPPNPPEEIHVSQWWREFLHMAEAAGNEAPATVLQRLEARRHELEMLFGAADRPGHDVEQLHLLWALLGRWAAAVGDADKASEYRNMVPRTSLEAYRLVLDMSLSLADREARQALMRGRLDVAVELWRNALEEHPDDVRRRRWLVHALSRRGSQLWEEGDAERAVALWSEARRYDVSSPELLHNLALGFERLGRWTDANKCRDAYMQVMSETRRATIGDGSHVDGNVQDASSSGDGGGNESDVADVHRAGMLTAMAENAWRAGQPQETRRLLDLAKPLAAKDPELLTRIGLVYACIGDGDKALHACITALALRPGYEPAIHCIINVTRMPGINDSVALSAMARSLDGVPNDSPVFRYWRGRTLTFGRRALEANDADNAMEAFASLLLADSGDIEAWLWAGSAHMKRGNRSGAEDCFAEAIRLNPDRAATYIELGARFLAEGDRARAEEYFVQAVKAAPGPETHVTIGELCAHVGVPDLAEHHLRASLTGEQGAEPFLVRAICGLLETGNEERVRPFLEEAHKIAPDTPQLQILVAVQHLRHHEWLEADASLREAQRLAEERGDDTLVDHVSFFRQALILLRTIGKIDERAFQAQIRALLEQWLAEAVDAETPADELTVEPPEKLLAKLPDPVGRAPQHPPMPDDEEIPVEVGPRPVDLAVFLNLHVPPAGNESIS